MKENIDLIYNINTDYSKIEQLLELYIEAYCNKNYSETAVLFESIAKLDDNPKHKHFHEAMEDCRSGQYDNAIEHFNQVLEIDAQYKRAWSNKGYALVMQRRYQEALECYNKALEIDPRYKYAWNGKGNNIMSNLGRYQEAIEFLEKAIEIDFQYQQAWLNKGIALSRLQRLQEAIICREVAEIIGLVNSLSRTTELSNEERVNSLNVIFIKVQNLMDNHPGKKFALEFLNKSCPENLPIFDRYGRVLEAVNPLEAKLFYVSKLNNNKLYQNVRLGILRLFDEEERHQPLSLQASSALKVLDVGDCSFSDFQDINCLNDSINLAVREPANAEKCYKQRNIFHQKPTYSIGLITEQYKNWQELIDAVPCCNYLSRSI